jgi:hypothetical protein
MFKLLDNAMLIAALCALSAGISAQTVYKCGNAYSQTPCPGDSSVRVDDPRDATQKKQTDAATLSDAKTGQAMEKERLAQEKNQLAASRPITPAVKLQTDPGTQKATKITPKRIKSKTNKPDGFVAQVPGTEKIAAAKKAKPKKTPTPSN